MTKLGLFTSLLAASQIPLRTSAQNSTVKTVDLGYATYQTDVSLDEGVTSFLGVRFAAPPTGDLRFRAPQPPAKVEGIQNATTQPPQCWGLDSSGINTINPYANLTRRDTPLPPPVPTVSDEDCLFLNVHVPTTLDPEHDAPLPVVVFIHGGGYDSQNESVYPAQTLVHDSNYSFISVIIQYRLGAFGFLPGEKVKEGGALNAGLLDQRIAFQWVQDHISTFGGDPTRVTLWGQSAGAGSVLLHAVAHGGQTDPPLFNAGIMSSPGLPLIFPYNDPESEAIYEKVVKSVNCTSSTETLACLRTIPPDTLLSVQVNITNENFIGIYTFLPVIDGELIIERPYQTLEKGKVNGNALLVDTVAHEGDIFVDANFFATNNITLPKYVAGFSPRLNETQQAQVVALYSNISGLDDVTAQAAAIYADAIFECPAYLSLRAFGDKAWKSEFAIPPALHGMDLSIIFSNFTYLQFGFPLYTNPDFTLAFRTAFFAFVENLDPNVHPGVETITPAWPLWKESGEEMLFNRTEAGEPDVRVVGTSDVVDRCKLWEELAPVNSQ